MRRQTMGRPTLLTPEVQEIICTELRNGMPIRQSCDYAGICTETYYVWMSKGSEGIQPYADFFHAATRARVEGTRALASTVREAALDDWRAAAWMLERRAPDEWSKRTEVSGPGGGPISVSDEAAREALRAQAASMTVADLALPSPPDDAD